MLEGSCHCGAVRLRFAGAPSAAVVCNCSICSRLGAVWGHGTAAELAIESAPDATVAYAWGDRSLAFHHCRTCGCVTHWTALGATESRRAAVNLRMFDDAQWASLPRRHFDGAQSWRFVD